VRPSVGIEAPARRLKLDFSPLLLEDYYLGKREAIEREDIGDWWDFAAASARAFNG
jgi:hypothetical protein